MTKSVFQLRIKNNIIGHYYRLLSVRLSNVLLYLFDLNFLKNTQNLDLENKTNIFISLIQVEGVSTFLTPVPCFRSISTSKCEVSISNRLKGFAAISTKFY